MRELARLRILALLLHMAIGQLGRRALARRGVSDPSQLELRDPRLDALDPVVAMRHLAETLSKLPASARQAARELSLDAFLQRREAQGFAWEFDRFLQDFGHLTESGNDFSVTPWRLNPSAVLSMIVAQAAVGAAAPRDRAPTTAARWARRVTERRVDRERIGAVFSRGFYLLHRWALKAEQELRREGVAAAFGDVFFLRLEEVRDLEGGRLPPEEAKERIRKRRNEMSEAASIELPDQVLGDRVPETTSPEQPADELQGIGVSRGIYEGLISVVRSLEDAAHFCDGGVLVVPFSDVAWTPLFSRAGAILAEAGGILSHSAIIARELGIPAVVSVPGVCGLPSGARVRVDGLVGRITLLDAY